MLVDRYEAEDVFSRVPRIAECIKGMLSKLDQLLAGGHPGGGQTLGGTLGARAHAPLEARLSLACGPGGCMASNLRRIALAK